MLVVRPCAFRLLLTTGAFAAAAMPKSDVVFQLHGAYGCSDAISFRSLLPAKGSDPFRAGASDAVEFQTRTDIGPLTKLILTRASSSDGGGSDGFFIVSALVENLGAKTSGFFLINQWLISPVLKLEPLVFDGDYSAREPSVVDVTVRTGRSLGAGTDAQIWMQWFTASGLTSGQVLLSPSCAVEPNKDPFERAQVDRFRLSIPVKIWPPTKLVVTQGFETFMGDWELGWTSLRLQPPAKASATGTDAAAAAAAAAAASKDKDRPRDSRSAALSPRAQAAADKKAREAKEEACESLFLANTWIKKAQPVLQLDRSVHVERYIINVFTADEKNAGTNSNIFMKMMGQAGAETEEFALKDSDTHRDKFERGNTDVFEYFAPVGLGALSKIAVKSDCSSMMMDAWKLDKVTCTHVNSGVTTEFICREWIDKKNPAVLLSATSTASVVIGGGSGTTSSSALTHELHVLLGNDTQIASTTSTVLLSLMCSKGRVNEIKLLDPQPVALAADASFVRRGVVYTFNSAAVLGDVSQMELRIIPDGDKPDFFPRFLAVRIAGGGGSKKGTGVVETLFYNTQPLDKKMPTMKLVRPTSPSRSVIL